MRQGLGTEADILDIDQVATRSSRGLQSFCGPVIDRGRDPAGGLCAVSP